MGVLCLASLKGGVGKTTLAVNLAAAFADRGCETVLIDLDPVGHASRFFSSNIPGIPGTSSAGADSVLARLFLSSELEEGINTWASVLDGAEAIGVPLIQQVRPRCSLIPAGAGLRHFLWGKGARQFKTFFPLLIDELRREYDYVIIDTAPDYTVLARNAIAAASLVVVPVDTSAMSIHCLEELINAAGHIKGPNWSIVRTMVNRQASTVQKMSVDRLNENLSLNNLRVATEEDVSGDAGCEDDEEGISETYRDTEKFISMLETSSAPCRSAKQPENELNSPIYLLNSLVYRSEQQNKLSFQGRTAFDNKSTHKLAEHYAEVARELENLLSVVTTEAEPLPLGENYSREPDYENFAPY